MNRPITHIAAVFVPVKDLLQAVSWWSALLDLPMKDNPGGGGVYSLPMEGTGIILDPNQYGFPHLVMYDTTNIDEAYRFAKEREYEIFYELQRYPHVAFFNMFDSGKNNGLMICQGDNEQIGRAPGETCPIRPVISRVFAHSGHVADSVRWYADMLGAQPGSCTDNEEGCEIRLVQGAALQLLDHRCNPIEPVRYEKLNATVASYPMFELTTSDLDASRKWIRDRGGRIVREDAEGAASRCFYFSDPDGNVNRVTERKGSIGHSLEA